MRAHLTVVDCSECGFRMHEMRDENNIPVLECRTRRCVNAGRKFRLPTVELVPVDEPQQPVDRYERYIRRRPALLESAVMPERLPAETLCEPHGTTPGLFWVYHPRFRPQVHALSVPLVTQNPDGSLSYPDGYTVLMDGSVKEMSLADKLDAADLSVPIAFSQVSDPERFEPSGMTYDGKIPDTLGGAPVEAPFKVEHRDCEMQMGLPNMDQRQSEDDDSAIKIVVGPDAWATFKRDTDWRWKISDIAEELTDDEYRQIIHELRKRELQAVIEQTAPPDFSKWSEPATVADREMVLDAMRKAVAEHEWQPPLEPDADNPASPAAPPSEKDAMADFFGKRTKL